MREKKLNPNVFFFSKWFSLVQVIKKRAGKILEDMLRHWIEVALLATFFFSYRSGSTQLFATIKSQAATIVSELEQHSESPMNISLIGKTKVNNTPGNLANTYSNMVYTNPEFATSESERARLVKRQKQEVYIAQFLQIAQQEMRNSKVPASITLAQGLLESNVGESKLATRNNNHFGIKCFSKTCKRGHCSNFEDDSHKDFFRKYKSPEESFHSHSQLLKKDRYRGLYKLDITDYKGWAHGLKKAGYATDPKYAYKIINLIEDLELHQYDLID